MAGRWQGGKGSSKREEKELGLRIAPSLQENPPPKKRGCTPRPGSLDEMEEVLGPKLAIRRVSW